jgi:hypothetical protein
MSEYKELSFFQKYRNFLILGVVFLAIGGFIGFRAYQIHAYDQKLRSALTFDPSAKEAYITPINYTFMEWGEYGEAGIKMWDAGSKVLTIPLPVLFQDDRTPILHLSKVTDPRAQSTGLNQYLIAGGSRKGEGLQEGDIIFALVDGEVDFTNMVNVDISSITYVDRFNFIPSLDADPAEIGGFGFRSDKPLKVLVSLEQAKWTSTTIFTVPVKKGEPIAMFIASPDGKSPQVEITGITTSMQDTTLNLPTNADGKVILLK